MKFNDIKTVVEVIESNPMNIDLKEVLKTLIDSEVIGIYDLFTAVKPIMEKQFVINGVFLPYDVYTEAVSLIKQGMVIDAIKMIRSVTSLGLKEAKDITDELKIRVGFKRNY